MGSHRIGKKLQGPKLRLVLISDFISSLNFEPLFSERGIFKGIQDEFKQQAQIVLDDYYQSTETKFTSRIVADKLKSLLDVRISRRQCCEHLSRIHGMIKPSMRALIKYRCRKNRLEVSDFSLIDYVRQNRIQNLFQGCLSNSKVYEKT